MSTLLWTGNAQAVPQVSWLVPANVEIGDKFTAIINSKSISFVATAATVANVVAGLVAAINANAQQLAEWAEVTASSGTTSGVVTHVVLTGPDDGKPFTVTTSTTNASTDFAVLVTTLVDGVAATNEQQLITLAGPPTGGTFTLTYDGQTTGAIAYNASAATVDTALTALSNIGATDVAVTGDAGGPWTVEFTSGLAGTNVPLITGNGSSLTGAGSVSVATTTQGAAGGGVNEVQKILKTPSSDIGPWSVTFNGYTTALISASASAAQVQAALEALASIGTGNVSVTQTVTGSEYYWTVTFINALGGQNVSLMTTGTSTISISVVTEGSSSGTNEVQTITVNNAPTGGTFTVTFSGQTTSAQAYNESAANLQADLEALSTIGAGNIAVTRAGSGTLTSPYVYTCTFQSALASTDVSEMTASGASLTGSAVGVATIQAAVAGTDEQQQVEITGGVPGAGNFTLTFAGETTANIAYNASAATVLAALEGLATPVPGDFSVTGDAGGPWVVTFTGAYAATDVAEMTGANVSLAGANTQTLVASTPTTPTGPNWVNNAANWSTGSNPVNGDIVHLQNSEVPILYGLDQLAAVTLAELHIWQSFEAAVGLPKVTAEGYYEYRPDYLQIGATLIYIGEGEGGGSSLIKLNTGTVQTAILVTDSGLGGNEPAIQWKGTHASNAVRVFKGSFGAAVWGGEAATILTFQQGYQDDVENDSTVFCGAVTWTGGTIDKSGGVLEINSAAPSIQQTGGTLIINGTGAVGGTLSAIRGGTVVYNTSGALSATTISGDGVLDLSNDMRSKTIGVLDMHGPDCRFLDPYKVAGNVVIDFNEGASASQADLGKNYRVTRGAVA